MGERLEEFLEREELVKRGFEERKVPMSYFFKTEDSKTIVYYQFKDGTYKRIEKNFPASHFL